MISPHPTDDDRALLEAARAARDRAYAPYSRFQVGAAVLTADGTVHPGANMENASHGLGLCAEVHALMAASFAGTSPVIAIAVTGASLDTPAGAGHVVAPCGRCRQLIHEAAARAGADVRVVCGSADLSTVLITSASTLLPDGFGPADLGIDPEGL